MNKKTLMAVAVLVTLAGPAVADYSRGSAAYNSGSYTAAFREFKAAADAGHATAQYMMGRLYAEGHGVDPDYVQSYAWFDLAASNGYMPALAARDALAMKMTRIQTRSAEDLASQWRVTNASMVTAAPRTVYVPAPASPVAVGYAPYSLRAVQSSLNNLGYAAGPVDGVLGSRTRAAIRAYQMDSGLPASGAPSVSLFEHLQATLTQRTQAAAPVVSPVAPANSALVAEVQSELRLRDYPIPMVTGQLDATTMSAIRAYQADASLPVNGEVSDGLLAQLRSGKTDAGASQRDQVKGLQAALNRRGYDAGPADGALGPRTRVAIRNYQAASGLPVTGDMSATLLENLGLAVAVAAPAPNADLRTSSIKSELLRHGYAAGSVDGILNEQTRSAIRAYQRDVGLAVNGETSQSLLDHLRRSSVQNTSETASQLVWETEGQLDRHGYSVGKIDGTIDEQSRTAIRSYQRDSGLAVNGRATATLLAHLEDTAVTRNTSEISSSQIWEVESRLRGLGYAVGAVDGSADQQTYAAVRAYQQDERLLVTGRLDDGLLQRLRTFAGQQSGATVSMISQTEEQLYRRGYNPGAIDGVANAQTTAAIRSYQIDAGLTVTGAPSEALLAHLRTSNVSSSSTPMGEFTRGVIEAIDQINNR